MGVFLALCPDSLPCGFWSTIPEHSAARDSAPRTELAFDSRHLSGARCSLLSWGAGEREQTLSRSEVRAGRALGKYIQSCPSFGKRVFHSPELSSAGACVPLIGRGLAGSEHEGQVVLESGHRLLTGGSSPEQSGACPLQ
ncbi:unnamed protein product [Gulo gulo]|uniref:Uncharacterized protein n=1 Tax=Gulo gulo TaxID=48420 RepID=A0A9X9MDB6_GULGU|nr:unnamed protein product [Gulo gulo]